MNIHEKYIKRCIQIAKNGLGNTRPNPMAGCVIVYNNSIIGEGFTSEYGGYHAEVNAVKSVKNKDLLKFATLYVTLEPCSHFGKTPPCSDLIIKNQIPKVVIGCIDDHEKVAGKGIAKLKAAGIEVIIGVSEDSCKNHHKRFFTFHNKKRPYIILKWAESQDGYIAPKQKNEQKPIWITNEFSRQLVHKWRGDEQSILVGTTTVLSDNPMLTARYWHGNQPTRIVIDKDSKLPKHYLIFDEQTETLVINKTNYNFAKPLAKQICSSLFEKNITSLIIEGGAKTLQTFIEEDLWDEARVFIGQNLFIEGTKSPIFNGKLISENQILTDTLKIYKND